MLLIPEMILTENHYFLLPCAEYRGGIAQKNPSNSLPLCLKALSNQHLDLHLLASTSLASIGPRKPKGPSQVEIISIQTVLPQVLQPQTSEQRVHGDQTREHYKKSLHFFH